MGVLSVALCLVSGQLPVASVGLSVVSGLGEEALTSVGSVVSKPIVVSGVGEEALTSVGSVVSKPIDTMIFCCSKHRTRQWAL